MYTFYIQSNYIFSVSIVNVSFAKNPHLFLFLKFFITFFLETLKPFFISHLPFQHRGYLLPVVCSIPDPVRSYDFVFISSLGFFK